ncbi:MAG: DUF4097 family beta strand repeat protein [Acidobacteriota bacterium]|nr:DUF4097 family beta strand repeat protein [Acidobacteriota bacterium]MDE3191117.1 DUF4097 family beta strand repeat protein [Acidobacteriota bacterium]
MTERTFHTPEPVTLEVKVPAGEILVETVDGDESSVVLEGPDKLLEQTRVELFGNRLAVELEVKGPFGLTIQIGDWSFGRGGLRVRARVPHGSSAGLATASADMRMRGTYGALDVKSASGDLVVEGDVHEDATIKTVSGDVRLRSVGGELRVQTVSGDLLAEAAGGDVTTKAVSGDIRIESARSGHVTAQSVSGDIEIGVAPGTNIDVDAGSVSGDLASEVPLASEAGAVGDGPVLVVRGKTVSGDVKVFRAV